MPKLGDANKPLAIACCYALLKGDNRNMRKALKKIAEVCNGYSGEAGWACRHAREALAMVAETAADPGLCPVCGAQIDEGEQHVCEFI